MTKERDPLELLRDAWRAQDARPPAEELEQADATTRATVRYLRDGYRAQAATPPVEVLDALRARRAKRRVRARLRLVRGGLALAAAAAVVLLLRPDAGEVPTLEPGAVTAQAGPTPVEPAGDARVRHVARTDYTPRPDGLEMRSGSVRLILLAPTGAGETDSEDS